MSPLLWSGCSLRFFLFVKWERKLSWRLCFTAHLIGIYVSLCKRFAYRVNPISIFGALLCYVLMFRSEVEFLQLFSILFYHICRVRVGLIRERVLFCIKQSGPLKVLRRSFLVGGRISTVIMLWLSMMICCEEPCTCYWADHFLKRFHCGCQSGH